MKRTMIFILLLGILLSVSLPQTSVYALNPGETLETQYRGPSEINSTKMSDTESINIIAGTVFGYQLQDLIIPTFNKIKQISTMILYPHHILADRWQRYLMPDSHTNDGNKIIHTSEEFENIVSTLFCARQANKSQYDRDPPLDITSTGLQKSSNIEYSQPFYENIEKLASVLTLYTLEPNNQGIVDMRRPTVLLGIKDARPWCLWRKTGKEYDPTENDVTQLSTFGEGGGFVTGYVWESLGHNEWIDDAWVWVWDTFFPNYNVTLTPVNHESNAEFRALWADPTDKEVEKSPYEKIWKIAEQRGISFNFLPEVLAKFPIDPWGQTTYTYGVKGVTLEGGTVMEDKKGNFDHPWLLLNKMTCREKQTACMSVPDTSQSTNGNLQATVSIGDGSNTDIPLTGECGCEPQKKLACPIDVIEQYGKPNQGACNLCNASGYTSSNNFLTDSEKDALPGGIPPLMKKVLEVAGATYHVPAAVLLGTMLEEGSFTHADTWKWTDETVKQFSDCAIKDPMPSCDAFAHPSTGAKGPFGFIQNWWDQYVQSGGPYKGVETDEQWKPVLDAMNKDNITQCNFVDAAFTAARELGEDQSHLYVPGVPLSCPANAQATSFGTITGQTGQTSTTNIGNITGSSGQSYPLYQGTDLPSSCSAWAADRVALARYQYGDRVCDDSIGRMVRTFSSFSCGQ